MSHGAQTSQPLVPPQLGAPLLIVEELEKSFGENHVLRGVSMEVARGNIISIVGPSGGGKSTLLRCLNLLEMPRAGRLVLEGREIFADGRLFVTRRELVALRRKVGMVFQQFDLFPHLTAIENVTLPLIRGLGMSSRGAVTEARVMLERVGLEDKILEYPRTLSGGQQQRVGIARALALRPALLLFDEPTSSLDRESTAEVLRVMRELAVDGMTMIVCTHEIEFAARVSDHALFLCDGIVVEEGVTSEVLEHPRKPRTQQFLKQLTV